MAIPGLDTRYRAIRGRARARTSEPVGCTIGENRTVRARLDYEVSETGRGGPEPAPVWTD